MSRTRKARAGTQRPRYPDPREAPAQQRHVGSYATALSPHASASSEYDFLRASWS